MGGFDVIRETFEERIQFLLPGMKILRKQDSKYYRFLGWLLKPIVPDFMTRFSNSGLDGNLYLDEDSWNKDDLTTLPILAHEAMHLYDRKQAGNLKFMFAYLFPQCLSVLAVLAFVSPWFLLALVFLLPIPAPFRANIEQDGYSIQLFVLEKLRPGVNLSGYISQVVDFFFGWSYYKMWPFNRKKQELTFLLATRRMVIGHPVFRFMVEFVNEVKS